MDLQSLLESCGGVEALGDSLLGVSKPKPQVVANRVAYIDGDYLAYIVSADRKDQEPTTLPLAMKHLQDFVEQIMGYAGADSYVMYITSGDKGGRFEQARLKEYQGNRVDKEVPVLLGDVRAKMVQDMRTEVCTDAEADDYLAKALYDAQMRGEENLAVLVTRDKDLRMVSGWHMDWTTCELEYIDDLGYLEVKEKVSHKVDHETGEVTSRKSKKLVGAGGLWFFAQLLMGDTADNVSGLPKMSGMLINTFAPNKASQKLLQQLSDPKTTPDKREVLKAKLLETKSKSCGAMLTYDYLKDCKTLQEALGKVRIAYQMTSVDPKLGLKDYAGYPISAEDALHSEARLLYMRHNVKSEDFKEYFDWIDSGRDWTFAEELIALRQQEESYNLQREQLYDRYREA